MEETRCESPKTKPELKSSRKERIAQHLRGGEFAHDAVVWRALPKLAIREDQGGPR